MVVSPDLVVEVANQTRRALTPFLDTDWSAPARDLEWSCRQTAAHIADSFFAQAAQLITQPEDRFVPAAVHPDDGAGPADLLQVIDACAGLLQRTAALADPATRAWHPHGMADPSGWVAMGVVDGLVHTWDIAAALGSEWRPPAELSAPAIDRLFPHAPDGDPAAVLLWCTGRIALPEHPRQQHWRWDPSVSTP